MHFFLESHRKSQKVLVKWYLAAAPIPTTIGLTYHLELKQLPVPDWEGCWQKNDVFIWWLSNQQQDCKTPQRWFVMTSPQTGAHASFAKQITINRNTNRQGPNGLQQKGYPQLR